MTVTNCAYCGQPMNTGASGSYRQVVGWTMQRKAGGANRIALPYETGRYMHGACFNRLNAGIAPEQGVML